MSDESSKSEKKGKRMVDTNVRVTKDTHLRLKALSDLWGVTMSEALDLLIGEHVPEIEERLKQREEMQKKLSKRKPTQD